MLCSKRGRIEIIVCYGSISMRYNSTVGASCICICICMCICICVSVYNYILVCSVGLLRFEAFVRILRFGQDSDHIYTVHNTDKPVPIF